MRATSAIMSIALVLLAGCVSMPDRQRVDVVVFNDSSVAQRLQISIDGDRVLDELASATASEPSIVSAVHLRLRAGTHRIDVTRGDTVRSLTFPVRAGTRTDVLVRLQNGGTALDVSYGERVYI
jgi:hypothetical protein